MSAEPVEAAITTRRSVRAFLPNPVPLETVGRILDVAARAPSGTNMQPWRVYVLTGAPKQRLSEALVAEHMAGAPSDAEYRYYPAEFPDAARSAGISTRCSASGAARSTGCAASMRATSSSSARLWA